MEIIKSAEAAIKAGEPRKAYKILMPLLDDVIASGEEPTKEILEVTAKLALLDIKKFGKKKGKD